MCYTQIHIIFLSFLLPRGKCLYIILYLSIFYVSLSANIFPGNLVSSMLENKSVSAGWCAAGWWEVGYLMIVVLFANKSLLLHFIANAILLGDGGLFLD